MYSLLSWFLFSHQKCKNRTHLPGFIHRKVCTFDFKMKLIMIRSFVKDPNQSVSTVYVKKGNNFEMFICWLDWSKAFLCIRSCRQMYPHNHATLFTSDFRNFNKLDRRVPLLVNLFFFSFVLFCTIIHM